MKKAERIITLCIIIMIVFLAVGFGAYIFKLKNRKSNVYQLKAFVEDNYKLDDSHTNKIEVYNETPLLEDAKDKKIMYKGYEVLGAISIPKIDISYPILNDRSSKALDISVIKYASDFKEGLGNLTLAAHNYIDETMFGKVYSLNLGDVIMITDNNNETVKFSVINKYRVLPDDVSPTKALSYDTRYVTLITCINGNSERLIVVAKEQ